MASSEQPELSSLKYLSFFEIVADKATKYVANIYGFAKESSGPLKPSVEGVETTVRMVVGPVYEKIEGKPHEVLLFVERKVDDAVGVLDGVLFQTLKKRSSQACGVAQEVPQIVKSVVNELQTNGIVGIAKSYYVAYEPVAEEWTCAAWKQLLKLPCAPQAVHFAAPPTLFCAEKFNHVVHNLKEMHVPLTGYIPTFPLEKLERVLNVHVA